MTQTQINYREILYDLVNTFCPESSTGVEIGTHKGYSAKGILACSKVSKIFLVDPYKVVPGQGDRKQKSNDRRLRKAKKHLQPYAGRYKFVRKTSDEAAKILDGPFDFVFIDGNHTHDFVARDLKNWFPKLKPGGLCIGDDWIDLLKIDLLKGHALQVLPGLVKAVKEFVSSAHDVDRDASSDQCKIDYARVGSVHISPPTRGLLHIWWCVKRK